MSMRLKGRIWTGKEYGPAQEVLVDGERDTFKPGESRGLRLRPGRDKRIPTHKASRQPGLWGFHARYHVHGILRDPTSGSMDEEVLLLGPAEQKAALAAAKAGAETKKSKRLKPFPKEPHKLSEFAGALAPAQDIQPGMIACRIDVGDIGRGELGARWTIMRGPIEIAGSKTIRIQRGNAMPRIIYVDDLIGRGGRTRILSDSVWGCCLEEDLPGTLETMKQEARKVLATKIERLEAEARRLREVDLKAPNPAKAGAEGEIT